MQIHKNLADLPSRRTTPKGEAEFPDAGPTYGKFEQIS